MSLKNIRYTHKTNQHTIRQTDTQEKRHVQTHKKRDMYRQNRKTDRQKQIDRQKRKTSEKGQIGKKRNKR